MWREAIMKRNQFWTAISKVLAARIVMLIVALILVPGARAAGKYKVLYKFTGRSGSVPIEGLMAYDAAGNIYGTTSGGGAHGYGDVFELTPQSNGKWTEKVLYSFKNYPTIMAGVTLDASGNLYGATVDVGDSNAGTIYQL